MVNFSKTLKVARLDRGVAAGDGSKSERKWASQKKHACPLIPAQEVETEVRPVGWEEEGKHHHDESQTDQHQQLGPDTGT